MDWQCYTIVVSHCVPVILPYLSAATSAGQGTAVSTVAAHRCCGLWAVSTYPEAQSIPGSSKPWILELTTVLWF